MAKNVRKHVNRIVNELHGHAHTTLKEVVADQAAGHAHVAKIPGVVADTSLIGRHRPLSGDRCVDSLLVPIDWVSNELSSE